MTDKYIDPPNTFEILEKLRTLPTLGDVKYFIEETFPDWIIDGMLGYSSDYPHLQSNWEFICRQIGVDTKQIVIVDYMAMDENHTVIRTFAELMSRVGFCVRRKEDLFPCKNCRLALPQPEFYDLLVLKGVKDIPSRWSTVCENCQT